jgi:AcrR family transcriptional regulator
VAVAVVSKEGLTREKILQSAIDAIDSHGEGALRIVDVARNAGVSQGMIRYYFGDRDTLVASAMAARFGQRYGFMLNEFAHLASRCNSSKEFRLAIEQAMSMVFVSERSRVRLERNSDIGKAKDHPKFAEQIADERNALCRNLAEVFESVKQRGLIKESVNSLQIAGLYLSFAHGISLWELGPEFLSQQELVATFQEMLFAVLFE